MEHTAPGKNFTKVLIPLKEGEWGDLKTEALWAELVRPGIYRLANVPFFVYGLSAEDLVSAEPIGDNASFIDIFQRGGHSTYRLLLTKGLAYTSPEFLTFWKQLESLGCTFESAGKTWIAVDVPPMVTMDAVYRILDAASNAGVWTTDEGYRAETAPQ